MDAQQYIFDNTNKIQFYLFNISFSMYVRQICIFGSMIFELKVRLLIKSKSTLAVSLLFVYTPIIETLNKE